MAATAAWQMAGQGQRNLAPGFAPGEERADIHFVLESLAACHQLVAKCGNTCIMTL